MNTEQIEQLFLHRQSCREFTEKPVPDDLVEKVCRLALLAPSACNSQPWKLIAVKGEKTKEVAKGLQDMGMNKFVSDAPVLVAIVEAKGNLTATVGSRFKNNDFLHNDIGILTAHLVLAADAAGLGSCIIGWRNEEKLRPVLGLDDKARIPQVVALGYPPEDYPIRPKKRKPLEETFSFLK